MKIPKKIKEMPWPDEYHAGQQNFIVTFSWPVIDHEQMMVATFVRNRDRKVWFQNGPGRDFRLVCSKKQNRAVILYKGDRSGKRHSLDRALEGFGTYASSCYPEITEQNEIALAKWLRRRGTNNHLIPELDAWVREAQEEETLAERDARGELRDEDVDLCPEDLPAGLVEYIRREVLPTDNILIYKKGNVRGTCYLCGEKVRARPPQRFKQNESTICPNCGGKVWAYLEDSEGYKVDYVQDLVTIQKGTDGATLFMRQWHLCRDPKASWEDIPAQLDEIARYAVRGNKAAKWQREAKENWCMNTRRYRLNDWTRVQGVASVYDGQYYFYLPEDWREQLRGTSLQYCDLAGYIEHADANGRDRNTVRFLVDWGRYPAMEKLWKAGYTNLIHERIRGTRKHNRYAIVWQRERIQQAIRFPFRYLKERPPEQWSMNLVQRTTEAWDLAQAGCIRESEVRQLVDVPCPIEYIKTALRYSTVYKVADYIDKGIAEEREERIQAEKRAREAGERYWRHDNPFGMPQMYRDYLSECTQLNLDLHDPGVLFPRNLNQAHQRTMSAIRHKASEASKAAFQERIKERSKLVWERGELFVRLPVSADELTEEGKALHHCVGGYADRMARGETTILFVRRKADPDKPFYTMEWRDGKVIQCRTNQNKSYEQDPQVAAFVKAWVGFVTGKKKKNRKANTAA